ncbi:transient receptor potential cation channel subfamily M member-like 2 [Saccostrea echinata]|uniref:transient receptor potential cation channel subfamily M member-like 2 n=1 Tax=Saccostrea echinata TaxID=191078 RepID=UPI002A816A26|nr:transient receptor potential cation channel subfamily M member-like 2 [Saccostrea echinata]
MEKKVTRVSPADPSDTISYEMGTPKRNKSLVSLHFNEEAVDAQNVGAAPEVNMTFEQRWIRDNIKMRVCKKFVEKPVEVNSAGTENEAICKCGYLRSAHMSLLSSPGSSGLEEWRVETNTRAVRTNAFGTVEFLGFGENERNYVRVDVNTKMEDMMELMMDVWGLEKPNLLISVTGGAKNFTMKQKIKEEFRRGLMKVARSTGAWIITGGTNAGVMKHVGEAVRDYGLVSASTNPIIVIGVATWGCIQNKEDLIDPECRGKWPASYRLGKKQRPKESFLDPNHTHFVLVDNGTQHQFGVEIPFRARMENSIANMKTNTGKNASVYVPVVLLVLEGGPGTLETAHQAVANNTPIVIVQGSGRAADILAFAYQNSSGEEIEATDQEGKTKKITQTIFDASVEAEIRNQVEENFGKKNLVSYCEMVKETLKNRDLITVFEFSIGGRGSSKDIDKAILQALLRANKDQIFDQLKLALAWNRIDIAKSEIFTDDRFIQTNMLFEIMQSALILNRVGFVELLMDNGVNLKDFLTKKRLLKLYNQRDLSFSSHHTVQEINKNTQLYQMLDKIRRKNGNAKYISLVDVGCLIQDLIGDFYTPWYLLDPKVRDLDVEYLLDGVSAKSMGMPGIKKGILSMATGKKQESMDNDLLTSDEYQVPDFDNPFQELFLWAVLLNRQEMAKILWKGGKDATAAALVASGMLSSLARETDDTELAKKLKANSQEFSNLAIAVLNECYDVEEKKAQNLLIRELEHWGAATCVLLAVESNNKKFISQTACQTLLNNVWMGHLSLDNQMLQLLLCVFVPPLIFPVIKFKEEIDTDAMSEKNFEQRVTLKAKKRKLERQKTLNSIPVREEKEESHVDYESKPFALSFWKKLYYFYTAPVVIFAHNVLSYVIFLGLYSYILLVKFSVEVSIEEIILIIWVFSIFAEEVRQLLSQYSIYERITIYRTSTNQNTPHVINPSASNHTQSLRGKNHSFHPTTKMVSSSTKTFNTKLHSYITDPWNIVDVVTIIMFIVGIILRFLPYSSTLEAARCVMALNLVIFFFRILHIFSVHKQLGPKLVMIGRMLMDLLYFIIILMVFVVSYSIAAHSVMFPNTELTFVLVYNVMRMGYWNLYGELFLEEIEREEPECTFDSLLYSNDTLPRCPTPVSRYAVPILMGFYVLFCNILLLNLLIAMFSNTYQIIQENTDQYWCFQRYRLIYEYYTRPTLAPPLILISHLGLFIRWIFGKCSLCLSSQPSDLITRFPADKARELVQWENMIADAYMNRLEHEEKKNIQNRIINTQESIHELFFKLDELQDIQTTSGAPGVPPVIKAPINPVVRMPPQMDKRLLALEEQMQQSTVALNWIMRNLQEQQKSSAKVPPLMEDKKENGRHGKQSKQKKEKDKAFVKSTVEERKRLNYKSRIPRYPQSMVNRFPVPDDKVAWEIPFLEYDPVVYEAPEVKSHPYWADTIDLIYMKPSDRIGKIKFNEYDNNNRCDRKSYWGTYEVRDGLPLNPAGRTGIIGRGLLGRYGPNHCGDPIVTRWKRNDKGEVVMKEGKKVLEFVAIFRKDNELWSIPGGMCEPGQKVSQCLKAEFTEEALGTLVNDQTMKDKINKDLQYMLDHGEEIYKGICDDPRNTDNAWLETLVFSYHDNTGKILHPFLLRAGETVEAATWLEVSSSLILHSSHLFYVKLVADKLNAYY